MSHLDPILLCPDRPNVVAGSGYVAFHQMKLEQRGPEDGHWATVCIHCGISGAALVEAQQALRVALAPQPEEPFSEGGPQIPSDPSRTPENVEEPTSPKRRAGSAPRSRRWRSSDRSPAEASPGALREEAQRFITGPGLGDRHAAAFTYLAGFCRDPYVDYDSIQLAGVADGLALGLTMPVRQLPKKTGG